LLARGKKKKQALMAVARKLLHAMFGMFRSDRPYDGARVYTTPAYRTSVQAAKMA